MIEQLTDACISEYRMDLHLLGAESEAAAKETLAHTAACTRCGVALATMRADREAFLATAEALPIALVRAMEALPAPEPEETLAAPTPETPSAFPWPWLWQWGATLAVATCIGLLLWVPKPPLDGSLKEPYIGYRGGPPPRLMVALRRGKQILLLRKGTPLRHRDQLRLAYRWDVEGSAYLFVVHRDPSNSLTPLYPGSASAMSIPIATGREQDLPGSLEVDDATHGREEIWACFSRTPLAYAAVKRALPTLDKHIPWRAQARGRCSYLLRFYFTRRNP